MKRLIFAAAFALAAISAWSEQTVVAVFPFTKGDKSITDTDAASITKVFEIKLQAAGGIRVAPRSMIDAVIKKEHIYQMGDLSDEKKTAELKKGLNSEWVVWGEVSRLGSLYLITAQLIDLNTQELIGGIPVGLDRIEDAMTKMDGEISKMMERISGAITDDSGRATVSRVATTKEYKVGDIGPAGGWIFYDKGRVINGWRYLEAAPPEAEFVALWGAHGKRVGGTGTGVGTGKANTQIIVDFLRRNGESGKAAQYCDSLDVDGYDDWFLPSKDELNLMYTNLKAKGLEEFINSWYLSSSEDGNTIAWGRRFSDGIHYDYKNYSYSVRAVRAF